MALCDFGVSGRAPLQGATGTLSYMAPEVPPPLPTPPPLPLAPRRHPPSAHAPHPLSRADELTPPTADLTP